VYYINIDMIEWCTRFEGVGKGNKEFEISGDSGMAKNCVGEKMHVRYMLSDADNETKT